jgi:hypothetical protein
MATNIIVANSSQQQVAVWHWSTPFLLLVSQQ